MSPLRSGSHDAWRCPPLLLHRPRAIGEICTVPVYAELPETGPIRPAGFWFDLYLVTTPPI